MTSFLSAWQRLDDARHRAEFYRMWRAGQSAGFTVPKTMDTMGRRESVHVEACRQWLLALTTRGEDVSHAVTKGGKRFEEFERTLLILGEESGTLDESLRLLAEFYARKQRLMLSVRKKMAYPMYTTFFAIFIAPFPLLYFGHGLAYLITVSIGVSMLVLSSGSLLLAVAARHGRKPALVRARFARALATAIEAGLPLPQSLQLSVNASADEQVQSWFKSVNTDVIRGQPVAATLATCPHMTPDFLAVLQTAERTGDYTSSMRRLAELYEDGFR